MSNVKSALRFIRSHPGFASLIVLTLALGIGLNTAVFSIVDGMLFRPMSYPDADRLYRVLEFSQGAGGGEGQVYVSSYQAFMGWRERCPSFDQLVGMVYNFYTVTGGKESESDPVWEVSADAFPMLGGKAALGRVLIPADNKPGAAPVAVLGQQIWKRRFGGDPGVLGRSIVLDDKSYTIAGVMEPGFFFRLPAELFVPMTMMDPASSPN